ncbi:hypothetical protein WBG78_12520 [Chryseolinea sp. T2]|uniref:OmpP1/FadL family transporter n=1 Tax=Chryseolinea sp. T2 TaxID=3129255 RepID=UPI003076C921
MQRSAFFLFGVILIFISSGVLGQSYVESALMFSRTNPGGSARIQGMGSSQTALGGDYSSAYSNPAGLGMFNRSEFTFTPAFSSYKTSASYLNGKDEATDSRFIIPGISGVFHLPIQNSGFLSGSFAISMTRTNDFNQSTYFHGRNTETSIIDSFIDNANGATESQFNKGSYNYNTPTGLAYYEYLIGPLSVVNPNDADDVYFTDVKGVPNQEENLKSKGASNQWNFAYGANYKDKVFFGLSVGLVSLKFKSDRTYGENFANDDVFNNLQLNEKLDLRGNGINATLGVIGRPLDFLQVGASFTTPTYYEMNETYEATLSSSWKPNLEYYDGSPLGDFTESTQQVISDYTLTTPLKFSTGLAYLSKYGIITADVDFVNPSKAKYKSNVSGVSFDGENNDIKATYTSAINYRIGGEFRYKILRVRAGYGMQGNTYNSELNLDNSIKTISGGIGARWQKFYLDFAYINTSGVNYYQPYSFFDGPGPIADLKRTTNTGMLTFGFTF